MENERMILDKYLSEHSPNRHLDKVIIKWFLNRSGGAFFDKSKEDWDKIMSDFFGETERAEVVAPKIEEPVETAKPNSKKGDTK
jgi:hypothetical protein